MAQHAKRDGGGLVESIRKAFALSKYPGDNRLVYDNSGGHVECNQVADAFRGKHWSELTVDFLRRHADSVFFFTADAYRFYLPGYLLAVVASYKKADIIPNNLVHTLVPPSRGTTERREFELRVKGLSAQQRAAIKGFLEYLVLQHGGDFPRRDPQIALEEYWGRA
jgi:hypothetical protein